MSLYSAASDVFSMARESGYAMIVAKSAYRKCALFIRHYWRGCANQLYPACAASA